MFEKAANIITAFLTAAFGLFMIFSGQHKALGAAAGIALVLLIFHLAFLRFKTGRLLGLTTAKKYRPSSAGVKVDTSCLLTYEPFLFFLNPTVKKMFVSLANRGRSEMTVIRPQLGILVRRARRLVRRRPADAAACAVLAWSLALSAQGAADKERCQRLFDEASKYYALAVKNDPGNVSLFLDWSRAETSRVERLASGSSSRKGLSALKLALARLEKAAQMDPASPLVRREMALALVRIAMWTPDLKEAAECLSRSVYSLEKARPVWNIVFYHTLCDLLSDLPDLTEPGAGQFWSCIDHMLSEAAAEDEDEYLLQYAALARYRAAVFEPDVDARIRASKSALDTFHKAIDANQSDAGSRLWAARCLIDLYVLTNDTEHELQALGYYFDAAGLKPDEETFSEWGNSLVLLAERAEGEIAARLWREAADKFEKAITHMGVARWKSSVVWHNWAYALSQQASLSLSAASRREALGQASERYKMAARLEKSVVTWLNWGDVLCDLAEISRSKAEADRLYREARDKFRRAARLAPTEAEPLMRWSAALMAAARRSGPGIERERIWAECFNRLEQAVLINAEEPETWMLWGQALVEHSWDHSPDQREPLLELAVNKYQRALELAPNNDLARSFLGRARLEQAEVSEKKGLDMAGLAANHFQAAAALKPKIAVYWSDWGHALLKVAELSDNEVVVLSSIQEAYEKFKTAAALEPHGSDHQTGLGLTLYQWGDYLEEAERKRKLFMEAYEHCRQASLLEPYESSVWRNWGQVLEALALVETDPGKSSEWQNEANEKYYIATGLENPATPDRRH
ncbi:hypothetical protein C4J81_09430 [Deltaproteobacteria bacterium Smac51]|nr:hypothetical protein C4J81_09430 [Deltaproteobacteria bacterium Smac51]